MYKRTIFLLSAASAIMCLMPAVSADNSATSQGLSLELIMSDPDWIGNPPRNPYWSDDGEQIYYEQKRVNERIYDTYQIDLDTGAVSETVYSELGGISTPDGDYSGDYTKKVYALDGDIFIKNIASGEISQITRTAAAERNPFFMADNRRVAFQRENTFFIHDPLTGATSQPADIRFENDPLEDEAGFDFLQDQQMRLFSTHRDDKRRDDNLEKSNREKQQANPARNPTAVYLGDDKEYITASLSPAGNYLVRITIAKEREDGRAGQRMGNR